MEERAGNKRGSKLLKIFWTWEGFKVFWNIKHTYTLEIINLPHVCI
jgi:hypothetical protein